MGPLLTVLGSAPGRRGAGDHVGCGELGAAGIPLQPLGLREIAFAPHPGDPSVQAQPIEPARAIKVGYGHPAAPLEVGLLRRRWLGRGACDRLGHSMLRNGVVEVVQ